MTSDTINYDKTVALNAEGTLLAGRYRIVRQLGQGGMGSVWLAEDTQLDNKPFAIKMLPSILVANKRAYRQLKDEALVAMKLTHPNIVTLRAFEENDGNPFLVMDYVDGQTLDDYLADCSSRVEHVEEGDGTRGTRPACPFGGIPEADVLRILRPIAAALDYAHAKGVVHRDVKPGNVMIAKDGTPYILDFGIAREIQETLTRVTGKLSSGTLLYMSPEQLNGASPKPAQDIYSFAAMVYECLKGEPPFARGQIAHQILNNPPPPLLCDGVPAVVNGVMAGLSKKPEGRPVTCADVLAGRVPREARQLVGTGRRPGGALKMLLAVALFVLLVGGGWWLTDRNELEVRSGRDITKENGQKERLYGRTNVSGNVFSPTGSKDLARKVASEIRVEAKVRRDLIRSISDADGFTRRKVLLAEIFARAEALFDERTGRWTEAAQHFSNYVTQVDMLVKLDGERQAAVKERTRAGEAKTTALQGEAARYATNSWDKAVKLLGSANDEFMREQFSRAGDMFASAAVQFETCAKDAETERVREETVRNIRAEAIAWQSKVVEISGQDGFKIRKDEIEKDFKIADSLFGEGTKRWTEAAQGFSNYMARAEELVRLDSERQGAGRARGDAEKAKERAEQVEAEKYATNSWDKAVKLVESANGEFVRGHFPKASGMFASAAKQFEKSTETANKERARSEHERLWAVERRDGARSARQDAESFEASTYSMTGWNKAMSIFDKANDEFEKGDHGAAAKTFDDALQAFRDCAIAARRKKQEMAAKRPIPSSYEIRLRAYVMDGADKHYVSPTCECNSPDIRIGSEMNGGEEQVVIGSDSQPIVKCVLRHGDKQAKVFVQPSSTYGKMQEVELR